MSADLAAAYQTAGADLRQGDRDRWLANLFAPAAARPHLDALYAFNLEIARIRDIISGPMPGEIRLQWWREAIEGQGRGDVAANPIAAALLDTIARCKLPVRALGDLIDARTFDLYDDPVTDVDQLIGYCGETSSALVRLACLILGEGADLGGVDAAGHAGVAIALTGLLRMVGPHAAQHRVYAPADLLGRHGANSAEMQARRAGPGVLAALAAMRRLAREHLAKAETALRTVDRRLAPAFLALALVEPSLRRMERRGYDPFTTDVELSPWRRQYLLWRRARRT